MIEENLMTVGRWDLALLDTTPQSILDLFNLKTETARFGHIIITPTHVDDRSADVLPLSRYTGIYRKRSDRYTIGGCGLAAWLGDEDDKGDLIESALTFTTTFVNWITALKPSSLTAGTYHAITGPANLDATFERQTRRKAIDFVCDYYNGEWRVDPDGTLHAGEIADLYVTTPEVTIIRGEGGRELGQTGVRAAEFDIASDVEDYTTRIFLAGASGTGEADIFPLTGSYDLNGNRVEWARFVEASDAEAGTEDTVAENILNRYTSQRYELRIASDLEDLPDVMTVGDMVNVLDIEQGIYDRSNPVAYRGETIYPAMVRLMGMTWPVLEGVGVYFRSSDAGGTVTDITSYVDWDTGATSLAVGAFSRPSR